MVDMVGIEERIEWLIEEQRRHHEAKERADRIRNIILFLILLVLILRLFYCPCPHPATVKGYEVNKYVQDQYGNPLEGATVILYNTPNGMIIAQGETDEHGWCNFTDIRYGRYFLWVSYGGIVSSEWVWVTEDTEITNTLSLPTEGSGCGHGL